MNQDARGISFLLSSVSSGSGSKEERRRRERHESKTEGTREQKVESKNAEAGWMCTLRGRRSALERVKAEQASKQREHLREARRRSHM